jgi:hypothetical protein
MLNGLRKVWRRGRSILPLEGFAFDRPLLVLQSDDWGRVGVRDRNAWETLSNLYPNLGERSYDYYSFETADDVTAIASLLLTHRDSAGRPACLGMNFLVANVDFAKVEANGFQKVFLRPLTQGLPDGWERPGLFEAYREGISYAVFSPALHGATHFCQAGAQRHLKDPGERGVTLRSLWKAGVPYIHWRMPWIGFEYRDSEPGNGGFLPPEIQQDLIDSAIQNFTEFFSISPFSACAPGYRADESTHRAWARRGIRVAQNGPGGAKPPHFDRNGSEGNELLHLYRSMDFEPAVAQDFSVDACLRATEDCFARGVPAVISVHSINFHSTLKDFRSRTLESLDQFLAALEARHPDLLYVRDQDLYDLIDKGWLQSASSVVRVAVTKRRFAPRMSFAGSEA